MSETARGKLDYRRRLYGRYVTDFTAHHSRFDRATFEQQIPTLSRRFSGVLPADRNANILDVACGSGGFLYFLRKLGYVNILGVDASPEQLAVGEQHGLPVERADAFRFLRDNPQTFDLITGLDVIEHFTKDEVIEFLELTAGALRPGGAVLFQTPNAFSPFGMQLRSADFSHEVCFTPLSLAYVLRSAGFADIQVYPCGPVPVGLYGAARCVLWRVLTSLIKAYNLIETGAASDGYGVFTRVMFARATRRAE